MNRRTVGTLAGALGVIAASVAVLPFVGSGVASAADQITTSSGTFRAGAPTTTVGVQPEVFAGNVNSCDDVGDYEHELNVLDGGWFTGAETTVNLGSRYVRVFSNDGYTFDWESNAEIGLVVVKAADAYNTFTYGSAVQADTGLHGPERLNTAVNRWQPARISHALFCWNGSIEPPEAQPPTVTNAVGGTYDETYSWDVSKSATPTNVLQPVGTDAIIDYTVNVDRSGPVYGNGVVNGSAEVTNPNEEPIELTGISVDLSDGSECTVDPPSLVLPPGTTSFAYTCDLAVVPPVGVVEHSVTVTWGDQMLPSGALLEAGSATYSDGGIEFVPNEVDECADVSDTYDGSSASGRVCGPASFTYSRTIGVTPGCYTYNNTAMVVASDTGATSESSAAAEVCGPQDLVVSKSATASYTRTYGWTIDKDPSVDRQGTPGTADVVWTVGVTKDSGTDSDFAVSGQVKVYNPNAFDVAGVDVVDSTLGGTCTVAGAVDVSVPAGQTVAMDYVCTFAENPGAGTNTALALWDAAAYGTENGSASGSAEYEFGEPTTLVNDSINVVDTTGASWIFTASGSASYTVTYRDPAGTCTDHTNTALIKETGQTSTSTTTVCVGADLAVTKSAAPGYTRTYTWDLSKAVNPTEVKATGGTATLDYTVLAWQTGFVDSSWSVSGTITVSNPNDWQSIDATLSDSMPSCTLSQSSVTVPASGSVTVSYVCPLDGALDGTNQATIAWDAAASYTPNPSASAEAAYTFGDPTTMVDRTVTLDDTFDGVTAVLGTMTATDSAPYASGTFLYEHTVNIPTWGCRTFDNTVTIVETAQSASASVRVCGPTRTGALTMGFWQNKNGQSIITKYCGGTSGISLYAFLTGYNPFKGLTATSCTGIASYVLNVIKAANASGTSMNPMLKAQMLASALDVYFSSPSLGGNRIGAPAPVGAVSVDLLTVCADIGSGCSVLEDTSAAFGGMSSMTVLQLLAHAAGQSNAGGTIWYGNVKSIQELAKDTFDAINNEKVFAP